MGLRKRKTKAEKAEIVQLKIDLEAFRVGLGELLGRTNLALYFFLEYKETSVRPGMKAVRAPEQEGVDLADTPQDISPGVAEPVE